MSGKNEALHNALVKYGTTLTLVRHLTVSTEKSVTCACRVVDGMNPDAVAGNIDMSRSMVVISDVEIAANGWPGPPRIGDNITLNGHTYGVEYVHSMQDGSAYCRHELYYKGM